LTTPHLSRTIREDVRRGKSGAYLKFEYDVAVLHITSNQGERWLLYPPSLTLLGVPADRCGDICQLLLKRGLIIRSGKKTGTVQERVVDSKGRIKKVRFWVLDVSKVRDAGAS